MTASTESAPRRNSESATTPSARSAAPRVHFDTKNLKSSYANVCTVTSTREEVVLNFGINQTWERGTTDPVIELTNRIILSPFAAKRLLDVVGKLMQEYEQRYGALSIESAQNGTEKA